MAGGFWRSAATIADKQWIRPALGRFRFEWSGANLNGIWGDFEMDSMQFICFSCRKIEQHFEAGILSPRIGIILSSEKCNFKRKQNGSIEVVETPNKPQISCKNEKSLKNNRKLSEEPKSAHERSFLGFFFSKSHPKLVKFGEFDANSEEFRTNWIYSLRFWSTTANFQCLEVETRRL